VTPLTAPHTGTRPACEGHADTMESTDEHDRAKALALCRHCPVLARCRDWVLSLDPADEPLGVVGGMSEWHRHAHRRAHDPRMAVPKTCATCKQVKTRGDFHKDSARRDGVRKDCKSCVEAQRRAYRIAERLRKETRRAEERAKARLAAGLTEYPQDGEPKPCSRCRQVKDLEEFPRDRARLSGISNRCKACHRKACRDSLRNRPGKQAVSA
jgi:hypothetical protein